MDRRQFMPRYTPNRVAQLKSPTTEPAKISSPRARKPPSRSAPPIPPPRNPRRLGYTPRSPEKGAKIWDAAIKDYVPRQPNGHFTYLQETSATTITKPLQHSISTNTLHRTPLLISASDQRESFGRSLHEEIKNLRQSYIDLQDDDVFAPTTPLQRSASSASLRTPFRNFSLPTYSSPTKEVKVPHALRRVRSRSVNLGPVAEASELPDLPIRRESYEVSVVGRQPVDRSPRETTPTKVPDPAKAIAIKTESKNIEQTTVVALTREGTCNCCGSTRKALAMNPVCCVDRPDMGRVCFRCWSSLLSEGLSKHERKNWLCCLVCGKDLLLSDAKRLASRGTILK